jgi:hypothetical protein
VPCHRAISCAGAAMPALNRGVIRTADAIPSAIDKRPVRPGGTLFRCCPLQLDPVGARPPRPSSRARTRRRMVTYITRSRRSCSFHRGVQTVTGSNSRAATLKASTGQSVVPIVCGVPNIGGSPGRTRTIHSRGTLRHGVRDGRSRHAVDRFCASPKQSGRTGRSVAHCACGLPVVSDHIL